MNTVTILGILILIFLSNSLIRMLHGCATGLLASRFLIPITLLQIPYLLGLLLPFSLFLGFILAFGRLGYESEMTILLTSGVSFQKLYRWTFPLIVVMVFFTGCFNLSINPWVMQKENALLKEAYNATIFDTLFPGRFQSSSDGKTVYYVESMDRQRKKMNHVFVAKEIPASHPNDKKTWEIWNAAQGYSTLLSEASHPDERYVVLENGERYRGIPGQNDYEIMAFDNYGFHMDSQPSDFKPKQIREIPSAHLWSQWTQKGDVFALAEFEWRLSLPCTVLVLWLIAIPLGQLKKRQGKYSKLFPAALIFIGYANGLFVARSWLERNMVPTTLGLLWVHGLVLLGVGALFLFPQTFRLFQNRSKRNPS